MKKEHHDLLQTLKAMDASGTLEGKCFDDIPNQVYHHVECPGYNSTILKRVLKQSFNHWYVNESKESAPLRFGGAFHTFTNEPFEFDKNYRVIADNFRVKAASNMPVDDRIIITASEFQTIEVMSKKLFAHPDANELFAGAKYELTYFSRDEETGLLKKCRVDAIKDGKISDLKSTRDASADAFSYDCRNLLVRVSAAFYLEVVSECTKTPHREFNLIACEKSEPHEIAVYKVDDRSITRGQEEVRQALSIIKRILDEGESAWRGYSLGIRDIVI